MSNNNYNTFKLSSKAGKKRRKKGSLLLEPENSLRISHDSLDYANATTPKKFSYFQIFRYSTIRERALVIVGIVLASLASLGTSYSIIIYGEFASLLIDRNVGNGTPTATFILPLFGGGKKLANVSRAVYMEAIRDDAWAFGVSSVVGALIELVLIALAVDLLNRIALKQIARIRKMFLQSILRQDMSWYDTASGSSFASKMTEDLDKMREGIGEKISIFIFLIMTFVSGILTSFIYGWKLTLVVMICGPFIIISTAVVAKIQSSLTQKELQAYSSAGAVAEEVFSGIRTVFAFSGERKEISRFSKLLEPAEKTGCRKGLYSGIGSGFMWFIIYSCYAVATWYGVELMLTEREFSSVDRNYTPAVIVIVVFCIIMGAQNLGFSLPHLEAFTTATGAAQNIFSIIDRKSAIDPLDEQGVRPTVVTGNISFEQLYFHYPSRPDVEILKGLSLNVPAGKTVAFVGASGCGKSTAIQLLQRFYDPSSGAVKLDGRDLRSLNVNWLRSQIGVVGQEPVLFATTIAENIRYGKPSAPQEDIEHAARLANCHDFITKLPSGYNTMVGERGAQMSGGQKQRIAIARALIRNPKILLLDEATSALDPVSERRVQVALEVASKGRTTLIVSHRLSTISNADEIVFIKDGVVAERGTHEELMSKRGLYWQQVKIAKRKEQSGADTMASSLTQRTKNEATEDDEDELECVYNSDEQSFESFGTRAKKNLKQKTKEEYKISFMQLMRLNAEEWPYLLIGCLAAIIHGASYPVWSIFFADFFGILSSADVDYLRSETTLFAGIFVAVGAIAGIGTLLQNYMFNTAGVKMTTRLRQKSFKTIISQQISYFDDEKNSVGALSARLAGDCAGVQGATGARIGIMVQAFSTSVVGIIIAFYFSWNMTLVTLLTLPLIILSIVLEERFMASSAHEEKEAIEMASQVAVEAIANIRTITSLGQEKYVIQQYCAQIDLADSACRQKIRFRGVVFGIGQTAPFVAYGISLYYGGILVANEKLPYVDIIKVAEALIFGSWMLGQAFAFAPNVGEAIISAGRLIKLFKTAPAIYSPMDKPYNTAEKFAGDITFEHVDFHYPTRQEISVLQNFNLNIKRGTTVALVGPSGCGKTTCVQLLLRYYDPVRGTINLSGIPTTDFSLYTLRSQMGLVSQEPVLFDRTIAENIAYGDNFREDIPLAEIIEAAKKSNIHDFITALPQGYETRLGSKGAQLSGGQKQRVAIARALVRNPKLLILDEATSALDMESEKVVQEALDVAKSGRTCVTIAHRLTTVRDADLICVLKAGVVAEQGTHEQLRAQNGIYAELYTMQQVD